MGNTISLEKNLFSKSYVKCYICKKDIENLNDLVKCVYCSINIHYDCEDEYRKMTNNSSCVCPKCFKVGSLGIKY